MGFLEKSFLSILLVCALLCSPSAFSDPVKLGLFGTKCVQSFLALGADNEANFDVEVPVLPVRKPRILKRGLGTRIDPKDYENDSVFLNRFENMTHNNRGGGRTARQDMQKVAKEFRMNHRQRERFKAAVEDRHKHGHSYRGEDDIRIDYNIHELKLIARDIMSGAL